MIDKFLEVFTIFMSGVAKGIFNKRNLVKIFTIFIVGFISRIFINYFFDVNVFTYCFSFISITYYFCMATFVVAVNHLVEVFDFSHLVNFLSFESIKPFIQFIYHFKNFLSRAISIWWKPTLFQPHDFKGKGKEIMPDFRGRGVEIMKFDMDINSQTGSGYFKSQRNSIYGPSWNFNEVESNKDWVLYDTKSRNSFNTPSTMTPLFQSQNQLPQNELTEKEWAVWCQTDNRLRSSNLQYVPRNSNDSSVYSHFTNDTTHSTIGPRPDYLQQNIRDYEEFMINTEKRRIFHQSVACSRPSQANRFSAITNDLKFSDKIRGYKSAVKNDLSRFFSLNGKSTVEGGGWKKGGRSVVRYYESKKYR